MIVRELLKQLVAKKRVYSWTLFLFFYLILTNHLQATVCAERAWVQFYKHTDWTRIREYFGYEDSADSDCVLRSDPQDRCGLYLIVKLSKPVRNLPENGKVALQYLRSDELQTKTAQFDIASRFLCSFSKYLYLGLTGDMWHDSNLNLTAWALVITDPESRIVLETYSPLWQM